jgi:hypothetical protein
MKTCSVCKHPRRAEIDEALIAGGDNAKIGKAFGPSRDAIRRHATHVLAIVKKYDETTALARGEDLKAKMLLREADLLRLQEKAEAGHDIPTAIAAIRELRQFHEPQARMEGQLKPQEVSVLAVNLDEQTSRRMAATYLERHPESVKR